MELAQRSVLKMFLASPGDLQDERRVANDVVDRVNKRIGRHLDIYVELRGWEDTLPGRPSRPQEEINEDLRSCDLFLGLVWQRWGTPPGGANEYESGFEEEFSLARDLHDEGQMRDILLYFKEMEDALEHDPGPQASKVLEFRDSMKDRRELFFDTFESTDEWENLLYDHLAEYLMKHFSSVEGPEEGRAPRRPRTQEETELIRADSSLATILESLEDDGADQLEPLEKARANFYTNSLVYGSVYPKYILQSQELAYLYGVKERVELEDSELWLVMRTLLADSDKTKSGWYWLDLEVEALVETLADRAVSDQLKSARSQARGLMKAVSEDDYRRVVRSLIEDDLVAESEATEALRLFIEQPREEDSEFLLQLAEAGQGDIAGIAWRGVLKLKLERDADEAIEWIIDTAEDQRGKYRDMLADILDEADDDHIQALFNVETDEQRARVFEAISNTFSNGELWAFARSDNVDLAAASIMELINRDEDVEDKFVNDKLLPDTTQKSRPVLGGIGQFLTSSSHTPSIYSRHEVLRSLYRTWSEKELEDGIIWSTDGALRYEILIDEYHENHGERLRQDIENEFRDITGRALQTVLTRTDTDQDSFIVGKFYQAAFHALASHATPDDVQTACAFLQDPHDSTFTREITKDALEILSQHGGPNNTAILWEYVIRDDVDFRRQAAYLILDLDPERYEEHAVELLAQDDWAVQKRVFRHAMENDEELPHDVVHRLLYASEPQTRRGALAYLVQRIDEDEVQELLYRYPQTEDVAVDFYYYDVVGWLDRILFTPESIREYYRGELYEVLE